VIVSRHQNLEQNHSLLIANKSFEKCGKCEVPGNDSNKFAFTKKLRADEI